MINKFFFLFASCILCFGITVSQNSLSVTEIDASITIDGHIDKEWLSCDSVYTFLQLEPKIGEASVRKTIVQAAQNEDAVFFLFKCYINNKNEIAAGIHRRDQLDKSDDMVSIVLDTYSDNRTAVLFQVNPIGTLTDAKISDDGKSVDYLWDTEWEAKTSVTDKYWVVEIKIPFKSIQYKPGFTGWGCNFSRIIKLNQEISWWSPVSENYRVSQNGKLSNINTGDKKKHQLRLFPYGTLRYENSDITEVYKKFKADAGVDLEYKYSSNFKANLTYNPDFATIEGDREKINLTPWELKFPEKRLFFQDGNEMFGTRIQTFYSRRIGDMKFGGKFIGKTGKYQFNALTAYTEEDTEALQPNAWFNAFRVKRDFLKSSTIGLTYTDKLSDSVQIHTYSIDYVMNLGKTWKLTGQFVGSTPGDIKTHSAYYLRFARENNIYHYHIRYSNIGENFRDNVNETGYINDDDRHEFDSDISYKFWINKSIKYLYLVTRNNVYFSHTGNLRSWYLTSGGRIYFKNRFSLDVYYNNEYKLLDKDYYNNYYLFRLGYNTDEATHARLSYRFGRNFDREFNLLEFSSNFQLFKKLSVNYELNFIDYRPDIDNESTTINVLGIDYFFTKDIWLRVFTQHNLQRERFYFYGLFGWRFKPPFGALYLIFNSDDYYDFDMNSQINSQIVFLKLTFPITVF